MRRRYLIIPALILVAIAASAQPLPGASDSLRRAEDSVLAHAIARTAVDSSALDAFERLIGIYKARKRHSAQLQAATGMVRANRQSPLAHLLLGDALLDNGNPDGALTYLKRAISLEPAYVRARVILAETYNILDEPDSALLHLDTALRQNPRYAQAHVQAARVLSELHRDYEATQHLRSACELLPDDASSFGPWMRFAETLKRVYAYDEALDALRYCLRLQPDSPDALLKYAETLELAGRNSDAMEAYVSFYYRFPADPRALDAERAAMRLRR